MNSIRFIKELVAETFGITVQDLEGPSQSRRNARPRQVAYCLLRKHAGMSLPAIGASLGDRDHTTVMSGIRVVETLSQNSDEFADMVDEMDSQVEAGLVGPKFFHHATHPLVFRTTRNKDAA